MILPERVQRQISTFSRRLRQCQAELKLLNAEERIEEHDVLCESEFMSIFRDTCILVQEEHATSPPYLTELTSEVQKIHNRALGYAYGIGDLYDFMPSWAHDDAAGRALIVDRSEGALSLPHATIPMMLEMLNIDPETGRRFFGRSFLNPELSDVATQLTMDEDSQMIYVGDRSHVKSLHGEIMKDPTVFSIPSILLILNVRTGQLLFSRGRVVRAGAGGVALWNTDELEMQGCDAETVIGDQSDPEEASHGGTSDTLFSSSIPRSSFIRFTDIPNLTPTVWEPLPNNPSTLLCAEYFELIKYGCVSIDLEYSGKTMARYLGHGGAVSDFSVSATDSQMFLTACHDGYARLFDIRQPLPVITLDACGADAFCEAVVLAHPDGIPTVFTGTGKHEQIKVWDIRACTPIYELATGNNAVKSLAWDSKRNCLYAATECAYMDRMGRHYDYRPGRVPSQSSQEGEAPYEEDYDRCWPFEAWHAEDYFGYTFDAGDHRIFRYAFKEDPDTSILPAYGDASADEY
ncbi:WD40 repeats protein, partial [Rhizoctonia solani]